MAVHIHLDAGGQGGQGGTTDYEQLENKPRIDGNELDKETTSDELGLATKEYVDREIEKIVPQKQLTAGDRVTIDEEGRINADKQLQLIDEYGLAVVIGGEKAGNEGGSGAGSVIEGRNNNGAVSSCIHMEGKDNFATGMGSHTEGTNNHNYGNFSHVEGNGHIVRGKMMHVFGRNSYPAEGSGIEAYSDDYSPGDDYKEYVEVVGNGTNGNIANRSNARMLKWNGDEWIAGHLYLGSKSGRYPDEGTQRVATEEYVRKQMESFHPDPSPDETLALVAHDAADISTGNERDIFGNPYKVLTHQGHLTDMGLDAEKLEKLRTGGYKRIAFTAGGFGEPLILAITGHFFRANTTAQTTEAHVVTAGNEGSMLLKLRWGDTVESCVLWWTESILFDD